jgi:hypothetical protein
LPALRIGSQLRIDEGAFEDWLLEASGRNGDEAA